MFIKSVNWSRACKAGSYDWESFSTSQRHFLSSYHSCTPGNIGLGVKEVAMYRLSGPTLTPVRVVNQKVQ